MQTGFLSLAVLDRLVLGSAVLSERSPGPECLVMSVLSTRWVYDYVYQYLSFLGSMRNVTGIPRVLSRYPVWRWDRGLMEEGT